jgi:hypothetical protein
MLNKIAEYIEIIQNILAKGLVLILLSVIGFLYYQNFTIERLLKEKDKTLQACNSELQNMQNSVNIFGEKAKQLKDLQETQAKQLEKNRQKIKIENKTSQEVKKSIVELFKANEKDSL